MRLLLRSGSADYDLFLVPNKERNPRVANVAKVLAVLARVVVHHYSDVS